MAHRYKLIIEYDGSPFAGWQMQANGASVQGELRRAISNFCGEDIIPRGAGRTDAGVHARGQAAHLDLQRDWPPETVRDALNFHLRPAPIVIVGCARAPQDFDARFSAKARHYLSRIINRRAPLGLDRERAWHVPQPLDAGAMAEAARYLVGRYDFTTFRASQCQAKSPIRTLDRLEVQRLGEEVHIHASARSFLHHQVRSIAGSLKLVGEGKWRPDDMRRARDAADRAACGPVAPAHGLTFMSVEY
jgi:tRNA pseudouridine38-40 synthase